MKKKQFKKVEKQMINVGINLNKIESLSRILCQCLLFGEDLKSWDVENLSLILHEKLKNTKQKFNNIERIMKI